MNGVPILPVNRNPLNLNVLFDALGWEMTSQFVKRVATCSFVRYNDRMVLVCHVLVNGLNVDDLIELIWILNPMMSRVKDQKMRDVKNWLEEATPGGQLRRSMYYGYVMLEGVYRFLDGTDRPRAAGVYHAPAVGGRFHC